jgi:hypothetical protein
MGIERSEAFLAEIDREHIRQRSGAIDDSQISELGRQFGVRYICVAAITPAFGAFQVSARIIDVETAQVIHIGESNSPLDNMDDFTWVSDEVVHVMFGGEPRTRPRPTGTVRKEPRISVGVGVLFSNDLGGGISREVAMPYTGGGGYLFIDAKYAQLIASYSTGGGKWESARTIPGGLPDMRRSFVGIGVYAKYPKLALGVSEKIKLFPLLGAEYEICVSGRLIRDDGSENVFDGRNGTPSTANDLSALWGRLGIGADFNFSETMHLRFEWMYGVRTANTYEGDQARTGHGMIVRVGSGVRF